ncbi:meiotic nuclear division protein 1 homolog isoform X3 [Cyprinus carpio]|uniref:Meiotic nuclear division protein 1 homolog n=1 Tax=Cyprinus carpio TaxID=7962 RepID=A0A9Q9VVZ8_CYPCA|nr:meiotic nuclear division protein 1 homolog isoform X3 [Cyprinus carpio]
MKCAHALQRHACAVRFPPHLAPNSSSTGSVKHAPMSVKEVLQSLVDDNMVDTERVGTSNYYWAFPSKALHARKCRLEELERQHEDGNQRKKALQQAVDKAKVGREVNEERENLLKELTALKQQRDQLKAELEKYKECDPEVVEEIRKANITAKEAVSRWTDQISAKSQTQDNVFAIKSWAKKKFGFENSSLDKAFGIPEDFDYIN